MDGNVQQTNNSKKNNNLVIIAVAVVVLILLIAVLYFTVFNKSDDKKGNNSNGTNNNSNNTNENNVIDGVPYNDQSTKSSFEDIGKHTTGIIYGDNEKAKIEFKYAEDVLNEIIINEKTSVIVTSEEELIGAYQIADGIVFLKQNKATKVMDAFFYKLNGDFLMQQTIEVPNMKYEKLVVNGNMLDFYFTMHNGKVVNNNGKEVNVCNSSELSESMVVEEVFRISYTDEDKAFIIDTPEETFKSVKDLKGSC